MKLSLTSWLSSAVAVSLLIGLLFLIIRKNKFLTRFGIGCIYILLVLTLLRGFLPFDFYKIKLTTSIYSYEILPWLNDKMSMELYSNELFAITPYRILFAVWFIGTFICIYCWCSGYHKTRKSLFTLPEVTESDIRTIYNPALLSVFPKKQPKMQLVRSEDFTTPAIFGLGTPYLILPPVPYTSEELYYIFIHEMLHYKRKDYLLKVLMDLLRCVHWWNPVVRKALLPVVNQIQELNVDYHVVNKLNEDQRSVYMETFTKTLHYTNSLQHQKSFLHTHSLADSHHKNYMIQRILYISNHGLRKLSAWGMGLCVIMFLLSFTIVFEPSYYDVEERNKEGIFYDIEGETFYVRNGDAYDFYMNNQYLYTSPEILDEFKDVPIYDSYEQHTN